MARRWLWIVGIAFLGALPEARAQWAVALGAEAFYWEEAIDPIKVEEEGVLAALYIDYTQPKPAGGLLAYRGRFYGGQVDYDGALLFSPGTRATADVTYTGMSHELQLRIRGDVRGSLVDGVLGVGGDYWEREFNSGQSEDYLIFYARLGIERLAKDGRGWLFGLGARRPFYTFEDPHSDVIFDQNVILRPGERASVYAQLGYQFSPRMSVIGSYESYRFEKSNEAVVSFFGVANSAIFQPPSRMDLVGVRLRYSWP